MSFNKMKEREKKKKKEKGKKKKKKKKKKQQHGGELNWHNSTRSDKLTRRYQRQAGGQNPI